MGLSPEVTEQLAHILRTGGEFKPETRKAAD
jgi:hypothetical protein